VRQFADAIERVRATAKWLIAAFAAVGAALTASIPLSNLGNAHGGRFVLAAVGAGLALVGIILAVLAVSTVLTPNFLTLPEVEELVGGDTQSDHTMLLGTATSLAALTQEYRNNLMATQKADLAYHEALRDTTDPTEPSSKAHLDALKRPIDFHNFRDRLLSQPLQNLRGLALLKIVTDRFVGARWRVAAGAFLVTAGMFLFAYGATATHGTAEDNDVGPPGKQGAPGRPGARGPQGIPGREGPPGHCPTAPNSPDIC
jgi:hypothetical protein